MQISYVGNVNLQRRGFPFPAWEIFIFSVEKSGFLRWKYHSAVLYVFRIAIDRRGVLCYLTHLFWGMVS